MRRYLLIVLAVLAAMPVFLLRFGGLALPVWRLVRALPVLSRTPAAYRECALGGDHASATRCQNGLLDSRP